MSTTRRTSKKQKAAPIPPEPASISVEGFADRRTPRPTDRYNGLPLADAAWVCNGNVRIYRYRVTVERIEESHEVIVDRLVTLYNNELNGARDRETLEAEAIRIGVENLKELARAAKVLPVASDDTYNNRGAEGYDDPWTNGAA